MKKVNKHGLPMNGLRKASGETIDWGCTSGGYTEIFYNKENGKIWTIDQVSIGENSWTVYEDNNIIKICNTSNHMTMQQIADSIYERLAYDDR